MKFTPHELIQELSRTLDAANVRALVESYVELEQRFVAGDWGPAELDAGRLCEAAGRCLLQLDGGGANHSSLPGAARQVLTDEARGHVLVSKDRHHLAKVMDLLYKFRSDRGAVHISPTYTANFMDSMLMLHGGKWLFAEILRLSWNSSRQAVAELISQLVQLEHSLIHELDGRPLVLAKGISAPDEVLLLLHHSPGGRLSRAEVCTYAATQKRHTVQTAMTRLIKDKDVRPAGDGEIAITPSGQKRVLEIVLPKWSRH